MLEASTQDTIKQAFINVRKDMPDFVVRFAQNKMIAQVSNTLAQTSSKPIACIEAPTGTGKTVSYLLSGIPVAKAHDKTLIVSTATVALQEQLVNKDLPDIQKYSRLDFSFALIKGRGRYACIRNLTNLAQDNAQTALFEANNAVSDGLNKAQRRHLLNMEKAYRNDKWNGESDTLDKQLEPQIWQKINCSHGSCNAKQCDFYQQCCFFNARKNIFSADVLVANHDLVLADLIAGNTALPAPSEAMYIFDEAHHLPSKSLNHFARQLSLGSVDTELKIQQQLVDYLTKPKNDHATQAEFKESSDGLLKAKQNLLNLINSYDFEDEIFLFPMGVIDDSFRGLVEQIFNTSKPLMRIIDQVNAEFKDDEKLQSDNNLVQENVQTQLAQAQGFYDNLLGVLDDMLAQDLAQKAPTSRWIERKALGNNRLDYQLNTAKIDIADQVQTLLLEPCYGAILTSATLSSLGNFDRLNQQLGLNKTSCDYLRFQSPFDCTQVPFIVADFKALPNQPEHSDEVAQQLLSRLEDKQGSLVLFTSGAQMQTVASLIEDKLGIHLLLQGEKSKQAILDEHKNLRDQGKGSIIFGLDSFYEGVDLPRHYLTHVVIVKLRFSVPNSPVERTTQDYLKSQHKNGFYETSLPDAGLKLIQACGRLIRSEQDSGKITIFDKRIVTKNYGKDLLSGLPDFKVVIE